VKRDSSTLGIAAILFAVLTFVGMIIASPPGGNYSAKNIADFVDRGHRAAAVVAVYLMLAAAAALLYLVAGLRERAAGSRLFAPLAFAAGTAWAIGAAILVTVPLGLMNGAQAAPDGNTVYMLTQAGFAVMFGAGGILLGAALISLALAGFAGVPAWLRWLTLVAGVAGVASIAFFPFFLLLVWALVLGIWLTASGRTEPVPATA
jgi:hypothetical protein